MPEAPDSATHFLKGDGETAALIRAFDWSATALGPIEDWPQSLKSAVGLIVHSPVPIVMLWGEDGVMIYNDAYSVFAGRRHPRLLGSKVREGWPEVADFNDNVMKVGLAGGTLSYRDQELTLYRNGMPEQVWMSLDYSPVFDEQDRPAGVIAIVMETTGRVLAQRRLKQESARQRRLFEQAPGFITILRGSDHVFEFVNQTYSRLFGDRDFVGRPVREVFPELHGQGFFELLDQVYLSGERFVAHHIPVRLERIPGFGPEQRYLDFIYEPVKDDAGHVTGIFCEGYDATDSYLAELALQRRNASLGLEVAERTEELRSSQARLRAIFETSLAFQGLMATDGTLLDANATSLAAIDARLEDVIGQPFWDAPWFSRTPGLSEIVRAVIPRVADGETVRRELHVDLPIGGWRWFDFVIRPIRNADGAVVAIVPEATETTERRHAEEALRQSQKLEAMGQLTGGVAHDFNNLLTPIVGSLDMLQRRRIGGEREQRMIEAGLQAAERASTLVQRLLAFARRQPLQPVAVDLADLIAGMAELIASTCGPTIKVETEVAPDLLPAVADPNQLEMAVLNLSVNARDAMPHGGTLTIAACADAVRPGHRSKLPPGRYLRLSVQDTGIGMEPAVVARAVEPFFSTKGMGKGTGLGLSMVHGLSQQLGGALVICSTPGKGTRVEMWLRISAEAVESPERPSASWSRRDDVGTALLVDDEDLARSSTADMLSDLGYHVIEANSAEAALRMVDDGLALDLLITDHLMPGMNGVDLAALVRQQRPGTPVLIVSGYAGVEGLATDLPRLAKPFRQADLIARMADLKGARS